MMLLVFCMSWTAWAEKPAAPEELPFSEAAPHVCVAAAVETQVLLAYTASVVEEAKLLTDILSLRLSRQGVQISSALVETVEEALDTVAEEPTGERIQWVIFLGLYSEEEILLALHYRSAAGDEDEVRRMSRSSTPRDTAWILGKIIEETLTPYFSQNQEMPALGAGLAIIEPKVVGGTSLRDVTATPRYPHLQALSLYLNLVGLWGIHDVMAGPMFMVSGRFSKHILASMAMGWTGTGQFSRRDVKGMVSQVPIELHFGALLLELRRFEIIGWAGMFLGFNLYRNYSHHESRVDVTFQPALDLFVHFVARLSPSWSVMLGGGARVPFVHDVLRNNGARVYKTDWVSPIISLGLQLRI
ncbi:MAG: hypothetical protein GX146_06450 [Myxococcales bacterium]|nr:hypothetical protein [Myxococcales bacterium]